MSHDCIADDEFIDKKSDDLAPHLSDAYLMNTGADAPKFTDEDLTIIGSPLDFVSRAGNWLFRGVQ